MSKSAWAFFLVTIASFLAAVTLPPDAGQASALMGTVSGVAGVLLLLALFRGRKIKFDPSLR
ncbi:PA3371 family protein [Pseudomonas sp.]|uniref:PA3371 family protein n=1 Tax=Pseudomonas sp. TaxID=306 RepID=UPI00258E842B|nr:PA3371 family protein [Pseudomonas sp.]